MDMDIIYHSTRSRFIESQNIFRVVGQTGLITSITSVGKNYNAIWPQQRW